MNEGIKKFIEDIRKVWFIPFMVILGIFMMAHQVKQPEAIPASGLPADQEFLQKTQEQICEMLKNIEGAGTCDVTITLSSGGKKEYVREEGNVLVITDKDGNQSAVVSQECTPKIAGVTVLSSGAKSITVRKNIIHAVSTALGIGSNKVCVVTLSGSAYYENE